MMVKSHQNGVVWWNWGVAALGQSGDEKGPSILTRNGLLLFAICVWYTVETMTVTNDESVDEERDNARLLMEQAQMQLQYQFDFSDTLDSKAQLVLTSGSIVITIGSGFVGVGATRGLGNVLCPHISQFSPPIMALGPYILGLVLYVIAVVLGGWAYFVKAYRLVPEPGLLVARYIDKPSRDIMRKIAQDTATAFENNKKTLSSKAKLVKLALGFFLAETVAIAASLFLLAIS